MTVGQWVDLLFFFFFWIKYPLFIQDNVSVLPPVLSGLHITSIATLFGAQLALTVTSLECVPTQARASGVGLLMAVSSVGQLMSPLLQLLVSSLLCYYTLWIKTATDYKVAVNLTGLLKSSTKQLIYSS